MSIFIITGANGQDAYFLSKIIKRKKLGKVIGISKNSEKISKKNLTFFDEIICASVTDFKKMSEVVNDIHPTHILNFAARASSLTQFDDPLNLMLINSGAVVNFLENIKTNNLKTVFVQASSSEVFAGGNEYPQNIKSPRTPRTFYGATKIFSDSAIKLYREKFSLNCYSVILYSHESPLRKNTFFTKKIIEQINAYRSGTQNQITLYSPSAKRDWGYAGEYANIIIDKILQENTRDYIIGTGQLTTVKSFAEKLLQRYGLNYDDVVQEIDIPPDRAEEFVDLSPNIKDLDEMLNNNLKFDIDKIIKLLKRMNDKNV